MRKAIVFVVILSMLLIFVSGCGPDTEEGEIQVYEPEEEVPEEVPEEEPEEVIEEPVEVEEPEEVVEEEVPEIIELELVLSDEELSTLEGRLKKSTEAIMSRPFAGPYAVGDGAVVGVGITNTKSISHDFNINVELKEVTTSSGTQVQFVDEETILEWFENDFSETYTLDDQEQGYYPLGFIVGDTINPDGDPVPEADFKFYVYVTYQEGQFDTEHARLDFTIKTTTE